MSLAGSFHKPAIASSTCWSATRAYTRVEATLRKPIPRPIADAGSAMNDPAWAD